MPSKPCSTPILACVGLMTGIAGADVLRVDIQATPGGDGSSWGRAFHSLTDALAASVSGDVIWVAEGAYTPETPATRDATFLIPDNVKVYGGFKGDETSFAQRPPNPFEHRSILKGAAPTGDPVYTIVTIASAGSGTVLDGFVLQDALADGPGGSFAAPARTGAAIHISNASPILSRLHISNCVAETNGGAIYANGAAVDFTRIESVFFEDNHAGSSGGAIWSKLPLDVRGCEFRDHTSQSAGGAVQAGGAGIIHVFTDCVFRSNSGAIGGGGAIAFAVEDASSVTIVEDCLFVGNSSNQAGAIGYVLFGDHTVRSSRFHDNEATSFGGGGITHDSVTTTASLLVENSVFTGNSTPNGAGGIYAGSDGQTRIVNCTVARNHADNTISGGGVAASTGDVTIDNSILWDNTPRSLFNNLVGTCAVHRSIVQALHLVSPLPSGVGAIDADPLFVDLRGPDNTFGTEDDNVRLMPASPAIDAGHNLVPSAFILADVYGASRYHDDTGTPDTGVGDGVNPIIDMGAAEFQGTTPGASCNEADLAEPFGQLDFTDVIAFLSAFGAMDPA
ncbi:MAG: right-handed parallel beta-helix repeat-containing protein, partial [Phycisphaerales bacterium JB059]